MIYRFNKRNNIYASNKLTQNLINHSVEVKILSECGDTNENLLLIDENGIVISFPKRLVQVNSLQIENEQIKLSQSMYDTWFKPKLESEVSELSGKVFSNFDVVVKNSNIILNDTEFRNIHLPFLKSTVLYNGSISYSLGKLLESWMHDEDLRVLSSAYMIKINVSQMSGINNYTAYSLKTRKILTNSLGNNDKNWRNYLDKFISLTPSEHNKNELLVLTRLIFTLGID
jgi:hypothetical protein